MTPLGARSGAGGSAPVFLGVTGPVTCGNATTVDSMDSTKALGEFLRARRELVRPEDVGRVGLRRVPVGIR
jgi:hypothetical protein